LDSGARAGRKAQPKEQKFLLLFLKKVPQRPIADPPAAKNNQL
jgi:hypothetical protein